MEFIIRDCKMISQYQYLSSNKRYYSKRGKDFIKKFQTIIRSQMMTKNYKTLESDNIECKVIAYFDNKRKNDLDNFVKPLLDNMEKCGVFIDDRYITKLIVEKKYQKPLDICAQIWIRDRNNVFDMTNPNLEVQSQKMMIDIKDHHQNQEQTDHPL